MCSIEIMHKVAGTPVGRRQALALGLGAAAAALLPLGGPALAQGNAGQSVPGLRIRARSDLTHTVTPTMPIYPAHIALLREAAAPKWGIENLANVGSFPARGATLVVGAPKVAGARAA
jgi:hypothetical protein